MLEFARVMFGVTASAHFLLVATTLGLAPVLVGFQAAHAARPNAGWDRPLGHLTRLYLVNYGIGIITGMLMELQMGVVWAGSGAVAASAAGAVQTIATFLAIETLGAFVLESTLLGLWAVSAGQLSEWVRTALIAGVAATAWLSTLVVLGANGWMHRPAGLDSTGALVDPVAAVLNGSGLSAFWHVAGAAGMVGGFWLAAAAARLALRRSDLRTAARLMSAGVLMVAASAPWTVISGMMQFNAARERPVDSSIGAWGIMLPIMMLVGVVVTFVTLFVLVPNVSGVSMLRRRWLLRMMGSGLWAPFLAVIAGWIYREEARQPWVVTDLLPTSEAFSGGGAGAAAVGVLIMVLACGALVVAWTMMGRLMQREPRAFGALEPVSVDTGAVNREARG